MNRLIKLCMSLIMLVACGLLSAADTAPAPSVKVDVKVSTDKAAPVPFTKQLGESLKYSIVLPTGWQTNDMGAQVLAWPGAANANSNEPLNLDNVPIKILVTAVDLTGSPLSDLTLDKLFEASLAEVKKNVGELNMKNSGTEEINGHKSHWGLMTYKLPGSGKEIQQLSYMFKEGKTAYVVECLVDNNKYDAHSEVCKSVIKSFKILEPVKNPIEPPKEIKQEPIKEIKQEPIKEVKKEPVGAPK